MINYKVDEARKILNLNGFLTKDSINGAYNRQLNSINDARDTLLRYTELEDQKNYAILALKRQYLTVDKDALNERLFALAYDLIDQKIKEFASKEYKTQNEIDEEVLKVKKEIGEIYTLISKDYYEMHKIDVSESDMKFYQELSFREFTSILTSVRKQKTADNGYRKNIRTLLKSFSTEPHYDELKTQIDEIVTKNGLRFKMISNAMNQKCLEDIEIEISELFQFHDNNIALLSSINSAFNNLPTVLLSTVKGPMSLKIMSEYTNIPAELITLYLEFKNFKLDYSTKSVLETSSYLKSVYEKLQAYDLIPKDKGSM